MKINLIYLLVFIGLSACVEKAGELPTLQFDKISAINLKHGIPLDSVVERTEIIRFTSDSALIIGKIDMVFESKTNFYLISDNRILRFNKKGEFLNFIGAEGKGPGEFISPTTIDVDDIHQRIYVMDYFGRKMLSYFFNGTFDKKFDLPDNFGINGFKLYQSKILYTSNTNSVSPELYIYELNKDKLTRVSSPEREMKAGEAFMGATFITGDTEHPFLFHYFNDTVFSIIGTQLHPEYLLQFGKLKIGFEELIVESGKKISGPRVQVYNLVQRKKFTFIQYGVTRLNGTRIQTQVTGIFSNDLAFHSPSINLFCNENPIFTIHSGKAFYSGYDNTLLTTISALDVLEAEPNFGISENDNPLLLKYYLR